MVPESATRQMEVQGVPIYDLKKRKNRTLARGDIWYVKGPSYRYQDDLSSSIKGDKKSTDSSLYLKDRPWLICQVERGTDIVHAAPISGNCRRGDPYLQKIMVLRQSVIHYEHLRPISRDRIESYITSLTGNQLLEMEARLSLPLGQELCNIYSIRAIMVDNIDRTESGLIFKGYVSTFFGYHPFTFTEDNFAEVFPEDTGILGLPLGEVSKFLNTLEGSRFVNRVMRGI